MKSAELGLLLPSGLNLQHSVQPVNIKARQLKALVRQSHPEQPRVLEYQLRRLCLGAALGPPRRERRRVFTGKLNAECSCHEGEGAVEVEVFERTEGKKLLLFLNRVRRLPGISFSIQAAVRAKGRDHIMLKTHRREPCLVFRFEIVDPVKFQRFVEAQGLGVGPFYGR